MDLFDTVKREVTFLSALGHYSPGGSIERLNNRLRVNPCPFCGGNKGGGRGGNDSFTIYPNETFYCYACEAAGDVISFVAKLTGQTNIEAARRIAADFGLSGNGSDAKPTPAKPSESTSKHENNPAVTSERACDTRRIVSEIYHDALMADTKALTYQTEIRKHSPEILRAYRIGYAAHNLNLQKECEKRGVSLDNLFEIGMLSKKQRKDESYGNFVGAGMFVYPHMARHGEANFGTLHFTLKDSNRDELKPRYLLQRAKEGGPKARNYNVPRTFAQVGWIGYNQDAILPGLENKQPVWIVEGEDDLLSLVDKTGFRNIFCTCGNSYTYKILEVLARKTQRDRIYYLMFDSDHAGILYTIKFIRAITEGGGRPLVCEFPRGKDPDDIVKEASDPKAAIQAYIDAAIPGGEFLAKHSPESLKKNPGKSEKQNEAMSPPPKTPGIYDPLLERFKSFSILGLRHEASDADPLVILIRNHDRHVFEKDIARITYEFMCIVGTGEIRNMVAKSEKAAQENGLVYFPALRAAIAEEAGKRIFSDNKVFGQGIWPTKTGGLLIVNGNQSWVLRDGKFKEHKKPIFERRYLAWKESRTWIDMPAVMEEYKKMTPERAMTLIEQIKNIFSQWSYTGTHDADLITGFFLANFVQTMWTWRPNLWVSGGSSTGKTLLCQAISEIAGNDVICQNLEGQTLSPAALRQSIRHDACVTTIDEFEATKHRDQILKMLRASGRGAKIVIGSTDQSGYTYTLRHMFMVFSIDRAATHEADANRFLSVEMQRKRKEIPQPGLPLEGELSGIRIRTIAYVLWAAEKAKASIDDFEYRNDEPRRRIESVAIPLSMLCAHLPTEQRRKALRSYVDSYLYEQSVLEENNIKSDEELLVETILACKIRIPFPDDDAAGDTPRSYNVDISVSQLLFGGEVPDRLTDLVLQANGIRLSPNQERLYVNPTAVEAELLKGRVLYSGRNISAILKRIEGATVERQRMSGSVSHVVSIPMAYLERNFLTEG